MRFLSFVIAILITVGICQANQYWKVGGSTTDVYSLDDNVFVGIANTDYTSWVADGHMATNISSTAELYDVISASFPQNRAAAFATLEANGGLTPLQSLTARRYAGLNITYTGQSGLNGTYVLDDQWLSGLMAGALIRCGTIPLVSCGNPFPNGASVYTFTDLYGVPHTMSASQMATISLAIQDYWANCVAQMRIALGGGTPAWPSNSVTVP